MKRIDSANVHADLFGPGKDGFQGGNPALNLPATFFNKDWCNHVQEEIANVIEYTGQSLNGSVYNQLVQAILLIVNSAVPVGTLIYVPFTTAPTGYLKANGAAVSRTAYAALYSAYGDMFGAGDGATTFNLPDQRGEFVRGWDDGRGIDVGRILGSFQGDAIRNITGAFSTNNREGYANPVGAMYNQGGAGSGGGDGGHGRIRVGFDASLQVPTAADNRPRNVAWLACVKF